MTPFLRRTDGAGSGQQHEITRFPFVVGRASKCSLSIDAAGVSGEHFRIVESGEQLVLEDLGSTNGTKVAGQRITRHVLADGDAIDAGGTVFEFRCGAAAPAATAQSLESFQLVPKGGGAALTLGGRMTIGRRSECDVVVVDDKASGRHCEIVAEGDGHVLKDLGSTNGTLVNGQRVETVRLSHGDRIDIGSLTWVYRSTALPEPAALTGGQFLLKLLGSGVDFEVPLVGDTATIGSDPTDTFRLTAHEDIGPRHVRLRADQGRWRVAGVDGPTEIRVCGMRTTDAALEPGDDLMVGPYHIGFLSESATGEHFLLTFVGGQRGGEEVTLGAEVLTIGRHPSSGIVIDNVAASSRHARILFEGGRYRIEDLGSTNGTKVGGVKIDGPRALEHGDRIELGDEAIVFRSTAQERPEVLRRERYVLIPRGHDGGGKPILIQGTGLTVGRAAENDLVLDHPKASGHHARIALREGRFLLIDLDSTNGTYVGGRKVVDEVALEHGDIVRFGRVEFVFKNDLKPLERGAARPIVPMAVATAIGAAALIFLAVFVVRAISSTPTAGPGEVAVDGGGFDGPVEERLDLPAEVAAATSEIEDHWPERAVARLEGLLADPRTEGRRRDLEELRDRAVVLARATEWFRRTLREYIEVGYGLEAELGGRSVLLVEFDDEAVYFEERVGGVTERGRVAWPDLRPAEMVGFLLDGKVYEARPLEMAAFALACGEEETGLRMLARYLMRFRGRVTEINSIYDRFATGRAPDGGWVLVGDRLGSRAEEQAFLAAALERKKAEEEERRRELERMKAELERLAQIEEAREAARGEFANFLNTLDGYLLSFDYARAIPALEEFEERLAALGLEDLVSDADGILFDARGEMGLFEKLIRSINEGNLIGKPRWVTASKIYEDVELAEASLEGVRILIPNAEIYLRWRVLDPRKLTDFFGLVSLTTADRYFLGKILLDHGLENAARHQWIQVVQARADDLKGRIDVHLAAHLGIGVPAGGFVLYEGRLVTPEEKGNLAKGLVNFRGEWMTRDERDKIQAGLVKYRDRWVSKDELEELKALEEQEDYRAKTEGFLREEGKWVYHYRKVVNGKLHLTVNGRYYPEEEARRLRGEWDNAWRIKTEHFDMRTNLSMEFAIEWADLMEEAWKSYAGYFGTEFERRPELFAFGTHEDYRRYCEETGNQGQLKAGGFADSSNNRGVGWHNERAGKNYRGIFSTMIHEGAHLYYFNAFPRRGVPSWYAEGIATQFEGHNWDKDAPSLTFDWISRMRIGTVKGMVLGGRAMKIEDLIRGNAGAAINSGPTEASQFYATAWAFKHFLDRTDDPRVRPLADEFFRKMNAGEFRFSRRGSPGPGEAPLEQVFGSDLAWLQKKFEDHVRQLK